MERTKYFNYTKPGETQLNHTEDSRARSILKRQRSTAQLGIRTGFRVSVNVADATKIDIGPGEGYTGGFFSQKNLRATNAGELISTLTNAVTGSGYTPTKVGQALANYASGTKNYISLVYAETESEKLVENRTPWTEHDTVVSETYTVEALTEANWLLLSNDELEQRILVSIVTAKGAGVALTTADIDQVVQPNSHPIAIDPVSITGVTIDLVSDETTIGTGVLRWDPATNMLYWAAPGDIEGTGTITASNGTYYLYSNITSYYLKVLVIFATLPAVATTESITIQSLYGRTIPMYSAIDQAHRDMLGTGKKSVRNPHAIDINDISGGPFEHADLFHKNGISRHAETTQLECAIDALNDRIQITNSGGNDNSFLIDGSTFQVITGYAALVPVYVTFNGLVAGEYIVYLDSAGAPAYARMSDTRLAADADFGNRIHLVDIYNTTDGACSLDWDDSAKTLTFTGVDGGAGTPVPVQQAATGTFYKLYSSDPLNWIIVYVDADLTVIGGDVTFNFATEFGGDDHPINSMLKLCSVDWDGPLLTETLDDLKDLRRFNTADNRDAVEEEHDEFGQHSKVIHNPFRVAGLNNTAIFASAGSYGLHAEGGNPTEAVDGTGVRGSGFGSADGIAIGAYGLASNAKTAASAVGVYGAAAGASATGLVGTGNAGTGGYIRGLQRGLEVTGGSVAGGGHLVGVTAINGSAANDINDVASGAIGVRGFALNYGNGVYGTGVYGTCAAGTGVYGLGANMGVMGSAATNTGVCGSAVETYGVYGKASVIGIGGSASTYGAYGTAGVKWGVYGVAPNTAVVGIADSAYGGYFQASSSAIYGTAANSYAMYGTAPNQAVVGLAASSVGLLGTAGSYGVYGSASNTAIYGTAASDIAIYAKAGANGLNQNIYAIQALANNGGAGGYAVGVYADAGNNVDAAKAVGIRGAVAGAGATGIYGYHAASGRAIFGSAPAAGGTGGYFEGLTGAYGSANDAAGIAVYGVASSVGGFFKGSATGGYHSASNGTGAYGVVATGTGVAAVGVGAGLWASAVVGVSATGNSYGVRAFGTTVGGVFAEGGTYGVFGSGGSWDLAGPHGAAAPVLSCAALYGVPPGIDSACWVCLTCSLPALGAVEKTVWLLGSFQG